MLRLQSLLRLVDLVFLVSGSRLIDTDIQPHYCPIFCVGVHSELPEEHLFKKPVERGGKVAVRVLARGALTVKPNTLLNIHFAQLWNRIGSLSQDGAPSGGSASYEFCPCCGTNKGVASTRFASLRANIDETVLLVVITEQGENRNQCEEQRNLFGFSHGLARRGT